MQKSANPLLLLDTNVWLSYYLANRPSSDAVQTLLQTAYDKRWNIAYPACIIKDVFYLIAAELKRTTRAENGTITQSQARAAHEVAWACVNHLREHATAVGVDQSDVWLACKLRPVRDDLEDDLVLASAMRAKATYLVTCDKDLIMHANVPALTPTDALAALSTGV